MNSLKMMRNIIPALSEGAHKGQSGRVGVFGGSFEYTGAPYFAASCAMKLGADLGFVFCAEEAATAIKCYSPELIVIPVLSLKECSKTEVLQEIIESATKKISDQMERLHALVVGPGLGRHPAMLQTAIAVMKEARKRDVPLIIDGDGLFAVQQHIDVVKGYKMCALTPNVMEFKRMRDALCKEDTTPKAWHDGKETAEISSKTHSTGEIPLTSSSLRHILQLCDLLDGPTIVQKGSIDLITDGKRAYVCTEQGSLKRCGGQGDLLAGASAQFVVWSRIMEAEKSEKSETEKSAKPHVDIGFAAMAASCLVRWSGQAAFEKVGRAMGAADMLAEVGGVFANRFADKER